VFHQLLLRPEKTRLSDVSKLEVPVLPPQPRAWTPGPPGSIFTEQWGLKQLGRPEGREHEAPGLQFKPQELQL
jgi:hypothetical protein